MDGEVGMGGRRTVVGKLAGLSCLLLVWLIDIHARLLRRAAVSALVMEDRRTCALTL